MISYYYEINPNIDFRNSIQTGKSNDNCYKLKKQCITYKSLTII